MSHTTLRFKSYDYSRYPSSTVVTQESFEKVQQALQGEQAMQEYKRRIKLHVRGARKNKIMLKVLVVFPTIFAVVYHPVLLLIGTIFCKCYNIK